MEQYIAKTIGTLFMSRTFAHMAHLNTGSYAAHVALNGFYDGIVDQADCLAEAAQGKFGKLSIPVVELKGDIEDPISGLESHLTMVQNLRKKCDDPALLNIYDGIVALYYKTLYLLRELS